MGKDYFIECLNEILFKISSNAKRLILWAEKTSEEIFLMLRVESMNGSWEKKTAEVEALGSKCLRCGVESGLSEGDAVGYVPPETGMSPEDIPKDFGYYRVCENCLMAILSTKIPFNFANERKERRQI